MQLLPKDIEELFAKIIEDLLVENSIEITIEIAIQGLNIKEPSVESIEEVTKKSPKESAPLIYELALETLNNEEIIGILESNEPLKNIVAQFLKSLERRKNTIVEILVEESSMENLLEIVLPQILPIGYDLGINCFVRPHQGKSDLKKSITKKVTAYQHFPKPVVLIVIQDQDSNDCKKLKKGLIDLIMKINPEQPHLVRIACKELENFYLGDMRAIEAIYPVFKANRQKRKAKYRNPDNVFGAYDLEQQIKTFSKGYASKNIPRYMDLYDNSSPSFNQLITGVQRFLN